MTKKNMKNSWNFTILQNEIVFNKSDFPDLAIPFIRSIQHTLKSSYFKKLVVGDDSLLYVITPNKRDKRNRYSLMKYNLKLIVL